MWALTGFYGAWLDRMGIDEVVVVGSSMGGWLGCEMALRAPGRVKGLVLIDATGVAIENFPLADVSPLPLPALMKLAHHDPAKILAALPAGLGFPSVAEAAGRRGPHGPAIALHQKFFPK